MADINLSQLRAEVRRAHVNATKKVSRLRAKGVEVGGTNIDPRRALKNVGRYNERQLRAYLLQLDRFRDRQTTFTVGAKGRTIDGRKWREYKRLERKYNALVDRTNARLGSIVLPGGNVTIAQRDAMLRAPIPTATGSTRPMERMNRNSRGVVSDRALNKLIGDIQKKLDPSYQRDTVKRQRRVARKMARGQGNKKVREKLASLSEKQFNILWNYTNFPTFMATKYHTNKDSSAEWMAKAGEDAEGGMNELLSWAARQ